VQDRRALSMDEGLALLGSGTAGRREEGTKAWSGGKRAEDEEVEEKKGSTSKSEAPTEGA
jgi:hypothetical protein